ncbi:MAG: hypothetical protein H7Z72_02070 [Bacteroidetes bacterium]|nr:hypothetical protein [Fibrella sp.]
MKTPLHTRLICCWLALVVLLGSTGFGMVEHWCQMRGHSKAFLLTKTGCVTPCQAAEQSPPTSDGPVVKKMPCCKTTVSYENLDVSRFVADQPVPAAPQPGDCIPNPQFRLLPAALLPVAVVPSTLPLADDPLHRTGRFRLVSGCTWLI